jgi:hypothetical protein
MRYLNYMCLGFEGDCCVAQAMDPKKAKLLSRALEKSGRSSYAERFPLGDGRFGCLIAGAKQAATDEGYAEEVPGISILLEEIR